MTQPTPDDQKAAAEKAAAEKAAAEKAAAEKAAAEKAAAEKRGEVPEVELLTFGHFRWRDHLLGHESDRYGVVFATGDVLRVAPIERYTVQVDPAEFTPVTADDVTGDDES